MPAHALYSDLTAATLAIAGAGELLMLPFYGANAAGVSVSVPAAMLNAAGQLVDPLAAQLAANTVNGVATPIVRALMVKEVYQKYAGAATASSTFAITGLIGTAVTATPIFSDTHLLTDAVLNAAFSTLPSTKLVTTNLPFVCAPGPVKPLITASSGTVQGYILVAWIVPQ